VKKIAYQFYCDAAHQGRSARLQQVLPGDRDVPRLGAVRRTGGHLACGVGGRLMPRKYGDQDDEAVGWLAQSACQVCAAVGRIVGGRIEMAHLSWCRWYRGK
jgi:hypothetical protein